MGTSIQDILVYATLAIAIGFLVKKYFIPKPVQPNKKESSKSCGNGSNCGCD